MSLKMNRCLNDYGANLTVWILQVCSIVINTVGRINTCAVQLVLGFVVSILFLYLGRIVKGKKVKSERAQNDKETGLSSFIKYTVLYNCVTLKNVLLY